MSEAVEEKEEEVVEEIQERPEWLPEKYSTPEDLAKAYKQLESKLGARDADIKKKLMDEITAERYSNRPEKAGDYKVPDFVDEKSTVDSDLLKWWSEHSFENGFSQDQFEKGIQVYMDSMSGPNLKAEYDKLGENADDRINAASLFANKFFPADAMPAIERMCETHEGIIALEAIMESQKSKSFSGDSDAPAALTLESLRSMMDDPRYSDRTKHDPAYIRKVNEGFKKLYG
jgi:hypothetical protein